MTINTNTVSGLFTAGNTPFASVSGNDISVSASAGKDPLFVIVDLTAAAADTKITVKDAKGKDAKVIDLKGGELNVIPVTTAGIADKDGNINLYIASYANAKIAALVYTPVINY